MVFSLSFSPDFFLGTDERDLIERSDRPLSVLQAIVSLTEQQRATIAQDVFGCEAEELSDDLILRHVMATDTCTDLTPPVEVWIDSDGFHTVLVFDA
ncbi:MAG: hypothetical protein O3B13_25315 [Planctomycetota bacterium]|nr:hypothetical protein [Planctomycetota bacterium]